jgi:hypothetical protein
MDRATADGLLAKIRAFVADELSEEEATFFAALVAPGVARATQGRDPTASGSDREWCPHALPWSRPCAPAA